MFKEFKEFALKGSIVNLAVGVIIGGAFQKIVTSLVNDIVMPSISLITGKVDYTSLSWNVGNVSIKYGSFLTTIIDFLLIALSIFLFVKYLNKFNKKFETIKEKNMEKINKKIQKKLAKNPNWLTKKKKEQLVPTPTTKICPYCLSEINIKASRCPHCTSQLELPIQEPIANQIEIDTNVK